MLRSSWGFVPEFLFIVTKYESVIWAVIVSCLVVTSVACAQFDLPTDNEPLGNESVAGLPATEVALLRELSHKIARVKKAYESISVDIEKEKLRIGTDLSETLELSTRMEIRRHGTGLFRVDGSSTDALGNGQSGIFLVHGNEGWNLARDSSSGKHFVTDHGTERIADERRTYSWYADAAYNFQLQSIDELLFHDRLTSPVRDVLEDSDEDDHRLLVVTQEITPLHPESIPNALPPCYRTLRFYRDHHCVLKDGVATGWGSNGYQILLTQRCEYEPLTDEIPRLSSLTVERLSRRLEDIDEDGAWKPYLRDVATVTRLSFEPPDSSVFHVENIVGSRDRVRSPRADSMKWVFGLSGLGFLLLWFLLRQGNRKKGEASDGSV